MNNLPHSFGFYAVLTDPLIGYEALTQILINAKVAFIQLRMKGCSDQEILKTGRIMRKITQSTSSRFIINDRPDLAKELDADGVHVGQDDCSVKEARTIMGPAKIVGLSTHSVDQVQKAQILKPDYIGMGPVFPTPTKAVADPALGLTGLKMMMNHNQLPFVAIGGIHLSNLKSILNLGVHNVCAVRPVTQTTRPEQILKAFILKIK